MKTKNKFLMFILCLCLIIPTAFIFSACSQEQDKDVQVRVQDGYVQWSYDDETWTNVISIDEIKNSLGDDLKGDTGAQGNPGVNGREIEFDVIETHIVWRYVGEIDSDWRPLVALSTLKGDDASFLTYTVTFDYGFAKEYFDNAKDFVSIKSTEWITDMPSIKDNYKESFLGWFVKDKDKLIEDYDFIGGNVTLVTKFKSGLYQNNTFTTWEQFKTRFSEAFDSGNIISTGSLTSAEDISYFYDLNSQGGYNLVLDNEITSIGDHAFYGCDALENIIIPQSITNIGRFAFACCESLINVEIPKSVTTIDGYAFYGCNSLESVIISEGTTSIGVGSFEDCVALKNVTLPDSINNLGRESFKNCTALQSIIIPKNVTVINLDTFYGCNSLEDIKFPNNLTSIYGGVFAYCSSLENVILPESVTQICGETFCFCTSLLTIVVPRSVTEIVRDAFGRCDSLTEVYYLGSEIEWNEILIGEGNIKLTTANIHYYSATKPTENHSIFWHYVDDVPTIWSVDE